jgi:aspartate dehydrogenase
VPELRIGLIGFGAIGRQVALGLAAPPVAILVQRARTGCVAALAELLAARPEVVIEAASPAALAEYAVPIVASGATLIAASGSALQDAELRTRIVQACTASGARMFVPSGALAGLDALGAAAVAGLDRVQLRITDPQPEQPVFSGAAWAGVQRYPGRLNVAATTALVAGRQVDLTVARGAEHELHLEASGAFGEFSATLRPAPHRQHIVALSLLATLQHFAGPGHLAARPRTDSTPDSPAR